MNPDLLRELPSRPRDEGSQDSSRREEYREGPIARALEQQTAKLPSDTWLWGALASIGVSLFFQISGDERKANFVGHWAPTLLLLGIYNKLVKLHGSDSAA